MVLVDSSDIAKAPRRLLVRRRRRRRSARVVPSPCLRARQAGPFFCARSSAPRPHAVWAQVAGLGDAMATFIEARAVHQAHRENDLRGASSISGMALGAPPACAATARAAPHGVPAHAACLRAAGRQRAAAPLYSTAPSDEPVDPSHAPCPAQPSCATRRCWPTPAPRWRRWRCARRARQAHTTGWQCRPAAPAAPPAHPSAPRVCCTGPGGDACFGAHYRGQHAAVGAGL